MPDRQGAERRQGMAALALRLSGAGYDEVADALGLDNAGQARAAAEGALEARAWEDLEGRKRLRTECSARIERLLRSVWPKAVDGEHPEHLTAVKVAKELIDRHIKLYGLDAPTEVVVHSPTAAEIDAWVAAVVTNEPLHAIEASVVGDG